MRSAALIGERAGLGSSIHRRFDHLPQLAAAA